MDRLTVEQACLLTALTGKLFCSMKDFHPYAEKVLGMQILTHEFGTRPEIWGMLQSKLRPQLADIVPDETHKHPPAVIGYTNYHGEYAIRLITPMRFRYGSSEYHAEPQYLIAAYDHHRNAMREFALKDIGLRGV